MAKDPFLIQRKYTNLAGIDNINDPTTIIQRQIVNGHWSRSIRMIKAENVDLHKDHRITRCKGYSSFLSGKFTSVWANDKICLAVNNGNLVRIYPNKVDDEPIPKLILNFNGTNGSQNIIDEAQGLTPVYIDDSVVIDTSQLYAGKSSLLIPSDPITNQNLIAYTVPGIGNDFIFTMAFRYTGAPLCLPLFLLNAGSMTVGSPHPAIVIDNCDTGYGDNIFPVGTWIINITDRLDNPVSENGDEVIPTPPINTWPVYKIITSGRNISLYINGTLYKTWTATIDNPWLGIDTFASENLNTVAGQDMWIAGVELDNIVTSSQKVFLDNVGNNEMVYEATHDDQVIVTNGVLIGEIKDGVGSLFPVPTKEFKAKMPAGNMLAFFNNALYVIKGNVVYISDVLNIKQYDTRWGFKIFESAITMFMPISSNGIFVSDSSDTYFMKFAGTAPDIHAAPLFTLIKVYDKPAVLGTAQKIFDITSPAGKKFDQAAVWVSGNNFCIGGADGYFETVKRESYFVPSGRIGTSLYRESGDLKQYLTIIK